MALNPIHQVQDALSFIPPPYEPEGTEPSINTFDFIYQLSIKIISIILLISVHSLLVQAFRRHRARPDYTAYFGLFTIAIIWVLATREDLTMVVLAVTIAAFISSRLEAGGVRYV